MKMKVTQNTKFFESVQNEIGDRLAQAAIFFANTHAARLGRPNPTPHDNPSIPGEYPKKRTGFLQKSVGIEPTDRAEIRKQLLVKIGYDASAFYGPRLEIVMMRLGLARTLDDTRTRLSAIIGQPVNASFNA